MHKLAPLFALTFLMLAPRLSPAAEAAPLVFSVGAGPMAAALDVAQTKGFFEKNGIKGKVVVYDKGADTLNAFLDGQADVGTCGLSDVIFEKADPAKHAIVATLSYSDSLIRVLARKDRGIGQMTDLRGKRIGTLKGSYAHYCLCTYLAHHGISSNDVTLVYLSKKEMPKAIAAGEVDAICQHGKPIDEARELLGDNWQTFQSTDYTRKLVVMLMRRDMLAKSPALADSALRAALEANEFLRAHPDESVRIMADSKGYATGAMALAMKETVFEISLNQSLLLSLESMERWAVESGLVERTAPRNYLNFIDPQPLERVAPGLVTLIR